MRLQIGFCCYILEYILLYYWFSQLLDVCVPSLIFENDYLNDKLSKLSRILTNFQMIIY